MNCKSVAILLLGVIWLAPASGAAQEFIGPHGYLTFEGEISNKDSVGRRGTFDLHHFNLLGDFLLTSRMRVFGEIEWEHGTDSEPSEPEGSAAGFVRLERAWFEYAFSGKLKLRIGKFLTPFGIYNEIHDAAPAYDTSILPQSIYGKHTNLFGNLQRFYAKFSTGLHVLGNLNMKAGDLRYSLFVANGRGRQPFEQDDNADKGVGLRLQFDVANAGARLGYSFYTDKNGLAFDTRQISHQVDFQYENSAWRFSAEAARFSLSGGRFFRSGQIAYAGYAEVARQVTHKQTVLLRFDVIDPGRGRLNDLKRDVTLGTSLHIIREVVIKAEVHFWHVRNAPKQNYVLAISSLAVVF